MKKRSVFAWVGLLLAAVSFGAEEASPVKVGPALVEPEKIRAGETFTLKLPIQIVTPWHIYPLKLAPDQIGLATEIKLDPKGSFMAVGEWREPRPSVTPDGDP